MIKIDERRWLTNDSQTVFANGTAFLDNDLMQEKDLVELFSSQDIKNIYSLASNINGFYGIIYKKDDIIKIVSDHVGSRAIFYNDNGSQISDSFSDLRDEIGKNPIPEDHELEFRMGTSIAGNNTLDPSIKKTEPGTIVSIDRTSGSVNINQYYQYRNSPNPQVVNQELYREWQRTLYDAFERTLKIVDRRQILLGLTGGYDSRLIAMMLDQVGHDDVVLFTIDKNHESPVASQIANDVGYTWIKLAFTPNRTREGYESDRWKEVIQKLGKSGMSHTLPSQVGLQKELLRQGVVKKNPVLLNGHQLYHSGREVPYEIYSSDSVTQEDLIDAIFGEYYTEYSHASHEIDQVKDRIETRINSEKEMSTKEAFEYIEHWYWNNRMPNFLSMRARELLQLDAWNPLLDKELVEFWNKIPIEHRYKRRLYDKWVKSLYSNIYGTEFTTTEDVKMANRLENAGLLEKALVVLKNSELREWVRRSPIREYAMAVDRHFQNESSDIHAPIDLNPLLAFVDLERFKEVYSGTEDVRYFLADEILQRLQNEDDQS